MRQITVDSTKGPQQVNIYDIVQDPGELDRFAYAPIVRKVQKKYLNIPAAFDIETTNVVDVERPYAYMYQWQFCIGDPKGVYRVYFGRTWEDFQALQKELQQRLLLGISGRTLVIFCHNLPFEWQFMRRFLPNKDVFLTGNRAVLTATTLQGIEYRDSYKLSNMTLAKWCDNTPDIIYTKNDGEKFDYHKIRMPWDPLTPQEESYCFCDVASVCECVLHLMESDSLATLPLTSTGFVRRDFRNAYRKNKKLRFDWQLYRLTPETYQAARAAFRGGNTHANYKYVGGVLRAQSWDISSSYPAAILYDQYPVTAFTEIEPEIWKKKKQMPGWAQLLLVRWENLEFIGEHGIPYLSIDKCKVSECRINDNGRVLRCGPYEDGRPGYCETWLTDVDLAIVDRDYKWSRRWVLKVYVAKYGPLPDECKAVTMEYFRRKTELKGVDGMEYEYGKAKNKLNSVYGMMVTNIARPEWEYIEGEYKIKDRSLEDKLDDFYKSRSNFLRYEQGIFVTANARRRLQEMLWTVGKDVIYVDTDSIKCRGDHTAEFEEVNRDMIRRAEELGFYADDPKGRRHYPGTWEYEGQYSEFKTLGAKRYIVKEEKDGAQYQTTIAGVNKKAGAAFFREHGIDAFRDGCVIENAGHTDAYYNDDQIHQIEIDGRTITTASNVALKDGPYTLGLTGEYVDLLQKFVDNIGLFL